MGEWVLMVKRIGVTRRRRVINNLYVRNFKRKFRLDGSDLICF